MIICCGEALMDMLPEPNEGGEVRFHPVPGGAIFNTAIALGRLGEDVGFFAGLSQDSFGRQLRAQLRASHVDFTLCPDKDENTTLAFVMIEQGQASYRFYDENSAGRMLRSSDLPNLPERVQALHFGGISLISDPCGSSYEEMMIKNRDQRVISLDPNIRPTLVNGESEYRARLERMLALSDIIKISKEDLDWLAPGTRFEDVAQRWLSAGAGIVILTDGEAGSRCLTNSLDVHMAAFPVEMVDTVGAGDTFNAGVLAGLRQAGVLKRPELKTLSEETLRTALTYGARAAAHTVSRAGADPPWRHEMG